MKAPKTKGVFPMTRNLVIQNVDAFEVREFPAIVTKPTELCQYQKVKQLDSSLPAETVFAAVHVPANGDDVYIGITAEVQKKIGFLFDEINRLRRRVRAMSRAGQCAPAEWIDEEHAGD